MCEYKHAHAKACMLRSEDNLQVLSFNHMGFRDQTLVIRLGDKCPCLWSHFTGPAFELLMFLPQPSEEQRLLLPDLV